MKATETQVFVIDGDEDHRSELVKILSGDSISSRTFDSAEEFLDQFRSAAYTSPQCLIIDVQLPGMTGFEILETLATIQAWLPAIILTGCADVPMAVRAIKAGAFDLLEKPFNPRIVLDRIRHALRVDATRQREAHREWTVVENLCALTDREREVLRLMLDGARNKQIAMKLRISIQTAAKHSVRVLKKLKVDNAIQLARCGNSILNALSNIQNAGQQLSDAGR